MNFLFVALGGALGVCGGFTTFSTFSLEAVNLFEKKQYGAGGVYVALSFACCIVGVICGKRLAALVKGGWRVEIFFKRRMVV